jgi:hypothetical protein
VAGQLKGRKKELRARMLCSLIIGLSFTRIMWDGLAETAEDKRAIEARVLELVELSLAEMTGGGKRKA